MVVVVDMAAGGEVSSPTLADDLAHPEIKFTTGRIAGFDFGLHTFLTCSDSSQIESPQFLKQSLKAIKKASRHHSKKGSVINLLLGV